MTRRRPRPASRLDRNGRRNRARQEGSRKPADRQRGAEQRAGEEAPTKRTATRSIDRRTHHALLDVLAADVYQPAVSNAGRTRRLAAATGQAPIQMELRA